MSKLTENDIFANDMFANVISLEKVRQINHDNHVKKCMEYDSLNKENIDRLIITLNEKITQHRMKDDGSPYILIHEPVPVIRKGFKETRFVHVLVKKLNKRGYKTYLKKKYVYSCNARVCHISVYIRDPDIHQCYCIIS
jgi:hypothetical protein